MKTQPKITLLSARESLVICLFSNEYSSKEITEIFKVVKTRCTFLLSKLNIENITGIRRVAHQQNLFSDSKIKS
jgi:ATP/maltotriose-dependent transcriptional regulator MalT